MEIKVSRDSLFKAISKVQSIIEKRSNMPILSMILITSDDKSVHISATDLEISMQQTIEAKVIIPGSITISGRKLFEILKESKSQEIYLKKRKTTGYLFLMIRHSITLHACPRKNTLYLLNLKMCQWLKWSVQYLQK